MTGNYDAGIDSAWQSINQKSIQKNFHSRKQEQQKQFEKYVAEFNALIDKYRKNNPATQQYTDNHGIMILLQFC